MTGDEVNHHLAEFLAHVDFTRHGKEESLGRDLAGKLVERIFVRCAAEVDENEEPWDDTDPEYTQEKLEKYDWDEINHRTGQMVSQTSLMGSLAITKDEVILSYGIGEPPDRSVSPNEYIEDGTAGRPDRDIKVTDIQKAEWAHLAKRTFFFAGLGDYEELVKVGQDVLDDWILEDPFGRSI